MNISAPTRQRSTCKILALNQLRVLRRVRTCWYFIVPVESALKIFVISSPVAKRRFTHPARTSFGLGETRLRPTRKHGKRPSVICHRAELCRKLAHTFTMGKPISLRSGQCATDQTSAVANFSHLTSAEQRQRSNRARPLLCNGTGPFFPTSAARKQRFGPKKQRSARVLARVLKDFL